MELSDFMPLQLKGKPSCQLTERSRVKDASGSEIIYYAGADGWLYKETIRSNGERIWHGFRIQENSR